MSYRTELTISGRGDYFTIFLLDSLAKERGRMLFTSTTSKDHLVIDDLITPKRSCGHGTIMVNQFITYAHKHFPALTRVSGYVRHDEIFNSSLNISLEEGLIFRHRRNSFWCKFGFKIIEDLDYHDNMIADLSDLVRAL